MSVELDDEAVVVDVAIGHAAFGDHARLAPTGGQAVGSLHVHEVGVLEHRVGALGEVGQHSLPPLPITNAGACVQRSADPLHGAGTGVRDSGDHPDPSGARGGAPCGVEDRVLDALAWRAEIPPHLTVESAHPVERDAGGRHQPASVFDGHMERAVLDGLTCGADAVISVGAQGGRSPERRGPDSEDGRPRELGPRQLAGVVDEHPAMHRAQVAPAQHALEVARSGTGFPQLVSRDHPRLGAEPLLDLLVHPQTLHEIARIPPTLCGQRAS